MSHYLVTGCCGFIGAKVTEMLVSAGHTVAGVDNMTDAYDVRLKQWRLEQIGEPEGFEFHELDISVKDSLKRVFNGTRIDAVVNLAARAGVPQSVQNPWVYIESNVIGTLNLLDACREFGVPKFVLSSTSSLYGDSAQQPFKEDQDTSHPLSPYAASKKAAEGLCYTYHYLHDIDVSILRYFTVYGPAGRPDMSMFRFTKWINEGMPVTIFGDGGESRDFTYVDDIARGTIAAIDPVGYEIINLGSDSPIKIIDVVRLFESIASKPAKIIFKPPRSGDVRATWADIGKAQDILAWRPQTDIEVGARKLTDWYQKNRGWVRDLDG